MAAPEAGCPDCGSRSARVHSRYQRQVSDAALGGAETLIRLRVRRFFCENSGCSRRTFAEQVPGLSAPYARQTPLLRGVLEQVALALGGRPGERLARQLAVAVSRMTLLRRIRALPVPEPGVVAVLGVDDFATRRGQSYGTIVTTAEQLEARGRAEGRARGRLEEASRLLKRQLARKFGPVPDHLLSRVDAARLEQLETWIDQIIDATTLDDVFA